MRGQGKLRKPPLFHRKGAGGLQGIWGDYDEFETAEALMAFLRTGKR